MEWLIKVGQEKFDFVIYDIPLCLYRFYFFSCLTDERRPDALPALSRTPRVGEVNS